MNNQYVWYLSYGSNLNLKRFYRYIEGGKCEYNDKIYKGCEDKTLSKKNKPKIINYEMYYAKKSGSWDNGGVCFLKPNQDSNIITYARMYLVKYNQFLDIKKQEGKWYSKEILIGYDEGYPIYTFTNERILDRTIPSKKYVDVIYEGLKETFPNIDNSILKKYLIK